MPRRNSKKKGNKSNKNRNSNPPKSKGNKSPQATQTKSPILLEEFKIFITMDSDWHIGSGGGIPGNVDRLVQRFDGIPGVI